MESKRRFLTRGRGNNGMGDGTKAPTRLQAGLAHTQQQLQRYGTTKHTRTDMRTGALAILAGRSGDKMRAHKKPTFIVRYIYSTAGQLTSRRPLFLAGAAHT